MLVVLEVCLIRSMLKAERCYRVMKIRGSTALESCSSE